MLAVERRKKIMELLHENGSVIVSQLSNMFKVTEETIRRDLEKLEKEGKLTRTYGGAYLSKGLTKEIHFLLREHAYVEGKDRIGEKCAEFIKSGDTIFLDSSTTALHIAKHIKRSNKKITVITNSLRVSMDLADQENIKLVCTGGTLNPLSMSFVGYAASRSLSVYFADKSFVSCSGIHIRKGIMDSNEYEAEIRKLMLQNAEEKILIADATKFGKTSFSLIASFKELDKIITDKKLDEIWIQEFQQLGIEVIDCES